MLSRLSTARRSQFRVTDSITDAAGNITPIVAGELSDIDIVSPNGYRYRRGFWDKVLARKDVKDMIRNNECLGTIEHPIPDNAYMKTPYEDVSHVVKSVTLIEGVPYGKFALCNNPKGNSIKALVDLGVPIGVSTRGLGDIREDEISQYVDDENYALITWDFTNNPNFPKRMEPISDSLRQNPLFKEFVELRGIVDTSTARVQDHFDMKKLLLELRGTIDKYLQMI